MDYLSREIVDCAIRQKRVSNLANNYDLACFFEDSEPYCSKLYVISDDLRIKFCMKTDCYIHCCGISDNGKYVIFQTANAPDIYRMDGNKHFLIDVEKSEILWKLPTKTNSQTTRGYFIDEKEKIIIEYHADYKVTYDFEGNFLDEYEWILNRSKHADASFYELIGLACELMSLSIENHLGKAHEQLILNLIKSATQKGILSEYQMANTYFPCIFIHLHYITGSGCKLDPRLRCKALKEGFCQ